MGKYRTIPRCVWAVQWTGDNAQQMITFLGSGTFSTSAKDGPMARTSKHSAWECLGTGDWVIRDEMGKVSIADNDDFKTSWQLVRDGDTKWQPTGQAG
jgi:hypothetical protein